MTAARRRPPGDGSVFEYRTRGGVRRFGVKFTVRTAAGERKQVMRRRDANGQPWLDRESAAGALREMLVKARQGWTEPSRQPVAEYLTTWVDGLGLAPRTITKYRGMVDNHVIPYIGGVPLKSLTSARLNALYRELEESGHRDRKGQRTGKPLAPRTVRAVAIMLSAAFKAAVDDEVPVLDRNPAVKAKPPTLKAAEAAAAEMHPWTAGELRRFLAWARDCSQVYALWFTLAHTGMRRGEALALRWRDVDLEAATIRIRRSAGVVRVKGKPGVVREGPTKTGKARVVDIDPAAVAVLRGWKRARGMMALQLARDSALVFGNHEGQFRNPESVSHLFADQQRQCARVLGDDAPPVIRLHDLRHTHATILLRDRENVKVVSERLGHANVMVTLTTYSHVMPGDQRQAAARFAVLVGGGEA